MSGIDLNDVAVFVRVVDLGAFAKAARELGVPTSTVSRSVARLEAQTGATLLQRTSRSLQTTSEGRAFYAQVSPALAAVQRAARGIEASDPAPRGRLRVTAPNDLGSTFLPEVVIAFTERHPLVEVELVLTTRMVNLIEERVDAALRAGHLPDSSLVARRIGQSYAALYAAPSYLAVHGAPMTVEALAGHTCLLFRPKEGELIWKLHGPEGEVTQRVRGRLGGDDYVFLRAAALAGAGIALLPAFLVGPLLASGALVRVLPQYKLTGVPLQFVHAPARVVAPKITAFRDFVIEAFARLNVDP
jgi:DNA-binding transcriptional LysR family regulator